MHVETLGEGEPKIAIVAAIHGDEPCGVHAVETLLDENPPVERPVKCLIANERALDRGVRFIDADLNRVFPGDSDAKAYERRLAVELLDELHGCRTLALHATQSTARPFAIVTETGAFAETICPPYRLNTRDHRLGGMRDDSSPSSRVVSRSTISRRRSSSTRLTTSEISATKISAAATGLLVGI